MKYDEFAFLNQQLAAMLRDGIPLEGALKRLCAEMRQGDLRDELKRLESALASGTPLAEALAAGQFPDLYRRLLLVGAKSNDLPAMLNLLADYYQRQHSLWTRLTGLMVYPVLVLLAAFMVSSLFYFIWGRISWGNSLVGLVGMENLSGMPRAAAPLLAHLWVFPVFFGMLFAALLAVMCLPDLRRAVSWWLPAFYESRLAHTACTLGLLLKSGIALPDAINLVGQLETHPRVRAELANWSRKLAAGVTKFSEVTTGGRMFPPLFVWLVSSAGEDLAAGFGQAAEIYQGRAAHRSEVILYSVLPVAVLTLGVIILTQGWLMLSGLLVLINLLGS
jgi:type II secretory pathway component PulF